MIPQRHLLPMLYAGLCAAWVLLRRGRVRRLALKFWEALSLLPLHGQEADKKTWRLAYCRNCVIYDAQRQTCGRAAMDRANWFQSPVTGRLEPYGCWCFLPVKSACPCNCWLYDHTNGQSGWPEHLNSFPLWATPGA